MKVYVVYSLSSDGSDDIVQVFTNSLEAQRYQRQYAKDYHFGPNKIYFNQWGNVGIPRDDHWIQNNLRNIIGSDRVICSIKHTVNHTAITTTSRLEHIKVNGLSDYQKIELVKMFGRLHPIQITTYDI